MIQVYTHVPLKYSISIKGVVLVLFLNIRKLSSKCKPVVLHGKKKTVSMKEYTENKLKTKDASMYNLVLIKAVSVKE